MFDFARKRAAGSGSGAGADRPRSRRPVIIGFEQLEGREMLSAGLSVTIIPDPARPLMNMPRPYIGSYNPEGSSTPRVSMTPRAVDEELFQPCPYRGRSRWRGLGGG
jgi:hypothetical protein